MSDWVWNEAARAVNRWQAEWKRTGSSGPWYLWFRRGELLISEEKPEGFELGDNERIPDWKDASGVMTWIVERARRLPCLPHP